MFDWLIKILSWWFESTESPYYVTTYGANIGPKEQFRLHLKTGVLEKRDHDGSVADWSKWFYCETYSKERLQKFKLEKGIQG